MAPLLSDETRVGTHGTSLASPDPLTSWGRVRSQHPLHFIRMGSAARDAGGALESVRGEVGRLQTRRDSCPRRRAGGPCRGPSGCTQLSGMQGWGEEAKRAGPQNQPCCVLTENITSYKRRESKSGECRDLRVGPVTGAPRGGCLRHMQT